MVSIRKPALSSRASLRPRGVPPLFAGRREGDWRRRRPMGMAGGRGFLVGGARTRESASGRIARPGRGPRRGCCAGSLATALPRRWLPAERPGTDEPRVRVLGPVRPSRDSPARTRAGPRPPGRPRRRTCYTGAARSGAAARGPAHRPLPKPGLSEGGRASRGAALTPG